MGQMFSAFRHPKNAAKCLREPKASNDSQGYATEPISPPIDQGETPTHETLKTSENAVDISPQPNKMTTSSQHGELQIFSPPMRITRRSSYKECRSTSSYEDLDISSIRTTEQAKMAPHRIGLPSLPTEIILNVTQYLPPSGVMSLSYSCRTIREKINASIEHSLGKKNKIAQLSPFALGDNLPPGMFGNRRDRTQTPPVTVRSPYHTERLKLLCMLDRDQAISPSKAVCSSCADTHDRSKFSELSLAQPPCDRRCIGSTGHVWICPHWIFDYNMVNISNNAEGEHSCGNGYVIMSTRRVETTQPLIIWPFVLAGKHETPSEKLVADFLAQTDVNLCKHLHLSDMTLSHVYSPDCKKMRAIISNCQCPTCVWQRSHPSLDRKLSPPNTLDSLTLENLTGGKCDFCGVAVRFEIYEGGRERELLCLLVRRRIPSFQGCTDRAWIDQVTDPVDFKGLERKWTAAVDNKIRTMRHGNLVSGC